MVVVDYEFYKSIFIVLYKIEKLHHFVMPKINNRNALPK